MYLNTQSTAITDGSILLFSRCIKNANIAAITSNITQTPNLEINREPANEVKKIAPSNLFLYVTFVISVITVSEKFLKEEKHLKKKNIGRKEAGRGVKGRIR